MTGAETGAVEAEISENLDYLLADIWIKCQNSVLLAKEVTEASDGILGVLHELVLGLVADVLALVSARYALYQ